MQTDNNIGKERGSSWDGKEDYSNDDDRGEAASSGDKEPLEAALDLGMDQFTSNYVSHPWRIWFLDSLSFN